MQQSRKDPVTNRAIISQIRLLCAAALALGIASWACQEASAASVSPTSINFQAVQGGASPSSQTITVSKGHNAPSTWTATDSAAWLSVSPGAGSMTRTTQITLSVNPSGLAAGTYKTTISVSLSKGGSVLLPVTLTINPASTTSGGISTTTSISAASSIAPGSSVPITVTRSSQTATDWLAFFGAGTQATAYMNWVYLPAGSPVTISLVAPTAPGAYELRLYRNDTYTDLAATKAVTVAGTSSTTSGSAILTWTLGTEPDLAGIKVYVGTASGTYNYPGSPFTIGKVSTYTINNLPKGQTYFFALSAFDTAGNVGTLSPEVSKSIY